MNCAQILARHEGSVLCVLASNGKVFSGAVDNTLKVCKLEYNDRRGTLELHFS